MPMNYTTLVIAGQIIFIGFVFWHTVAATVKKLPTDGITVDQPPTATVTDESGTAECKLITVIRLIFTYKYFRGLKCRGV